MMCRGLLRCSCRNLRSCRSLRANGSTFFERGLMFQPSCYSVGFGTAAVLYESKRAQMPIYTRTGDAGTSATFTGERRRKDDVIFEALGCIDELSASIGLARALSDESVAALCDKQLRHVQCVLQEVGSMVATPTSSARPAHLRRLATPTSVDDHAHVSATARSAVLADCVVSELEQWIDQHSHTLPPLTNFILPSGGVSASSLHVARTVCRRTERSLQPLVRDGQLDSSAAIYINRLSDYLFTVARVAAHCCQIVEDIYRPTGNHTVVS